jgi:hypothetical protein
MVIALGFRSLFKGFCSKYCGLPIIFCLVCITQNTRSGNKTIPLLIAVNHNYAATFINEEWIPLLPVGGVPGNMGGRKSRMWRAISRSRLDSKCTV